MALDEKSSYYDVGGIEVINIIKAKLTPEQFKGYLLGNVIKYSCCLNFKNKDSGVRDAEKIGHYNELLKVHTSDLQFHKESSFAINAEPIKKVSSSTNFNFVQFESDLINFSSGQILNVEAIMRLLRKSVVES